MPPPLRERRRRSAGCATNLFSGRLNIVLTMLSALLLLLDRSAAAQFPVLRRGLDREPTATPASRPPDAPAGRRLLGLRASSAFTYFIYGFYPIPQRWRVDVFFALLVDRHRLAAVAAGAAPRSRRDLLLHRAADRLVHPAARLAGHRLADRARPRSWGGLLVTIVVSAVGIVVSLPLGIVLALGRRSQMPAVRLFSVIFIEFVRGVPLITVLFMASVMLPLFVPDAWSPDKLLRALIGVALFASAYMAEVVRGGLQAIPKGQYEGAMALGLGYWQMMRLIVLPQALRITIPEYRQQLYRAVQGHDAGLHRRHLRFSAHDRGRAHRSEMGDAGDEHDRLCLRRDLLFPVLLSDVALCGEHGGAAGHRPQALTGGDGWNGTQPRMPSLPRR